MLQFPQGFETIIHDCVNNNTQFIINNNKIDKAETSNGETAPSTCNGCLSVCKAVVKARETLSLLIHKDGSNPTANRDIYWCNG